MIEIYTRRNPNEFEAIQFDGKNIKEIEEFTGGKIRKETFDYGVRICHYELVLQKHILYNRILTLNVFDYIVIVNHKFRIYDSYLMKKTFKKK